MNVSVGRQSPHLLATALATSRDRRVARAIVVLSLVLFLAAVPFVRVPLPKMPAFIPAYEAALFLIDLVTALLLFDQFLRLSALGLLVLASGYLFDAMIIVPHALSFPGGFSVAGLLGAKEQTTAWLYVFWHGGFSLFVLAYALLRRNESARPIARPGRALVIAVAAVSALTIGFALAATWGHDWLPVVMQGSDYSNLVWKGISPAVWLLTFAAMIALWRRHQRVVDLWLMVVMWVWLLDIGLSAVVGSTRFDLGFYVGRLFGLVASGFLLVVLLIEMARMYSGALGAAAEAGERLEQLSRSHGRAEIGPLHRESEAEFVSRQNIEHYRALLQGTTLARAQRDSIEKLLAEEERKQPPPKDL